MQPSKPSVLVIDASVILWAVLPGPVDTLPLFESWQDAFLLAPGIWLPEAISTIRYLVYGGNLNKDEARQAVEDVFSLGVETSPADIFLAQRALTWAERLQQRRAYDAFYVALADQLQASFWSADKRLVNGLRALGVSWAHWVGEMDGE
jgi:predicted nucleic acid-binding protein